MRSVRLDIDPGQLVGPAGMSLAHGRLVATVVSLKTDKHITMRLTAKRPPNEAEGEKRWRVCPFEDAKAVFADVPRGDRLLVGDSPGKYVPRSGLFVPRPDADPARVWVACYLLRFAAGQPLNPEARVEQSVNCFHCGRELTDPESISRGVGPVCYGKITKSEHQRKGDPAPPTVAPQVELALDARTKEAV